MLRAVTFDFWNTLIEPPADAFAVRARRLAGWLRADEDAVLRVLVEGFELHDAAWRAGEAWGPGRMAAMLVDRFRPDGLDVERVRELVETSAAEAGERAMPGAVETVRALRRAGLRLGVVCDAGFSPGYVLRGFLERAGLREHFEPAALTFSDEVGVYKPDPRIFEVTLHALGAAPAEAAHVGDLRFTDIAGARAVGMRTVRFRGHADDTADGPEADVVIASLLDLPAALGVA
jgi:FMN phosphatase YigB (HAD superfamily)